MDRLHDKPTHEMMFMERLWARIRAEFATRKDVLQVAEGLRVLEQEVTEQADKLNSAQINGVCGAPQYNDAANALAVSAAAMVIKAMQQDLKKHSGIKIAVCEKDSEGHPIVQAIDYKTIYLTPGGDGEDDSNWDEWIAIKQRSVRMPYRWEHLGAKKVDLSWIRKDLHSLNHALEKLCIKIDRVSQYLGKAILDKAVKPLEDLKVYISSSEFAAQVAQEMPIATPLNKGLMSSEAYTLLSMLAIWASNDYETIGGGALGADKVNEMLDDNENLKDLGEN